MSIHQCPYCSAANTVVVKDSRPWKARDVVCRRRYECSACLQRFTTAEVIVSLSTDNSPTHNTNWLLRRWMDKIKSDGKREILARLNAELAETEST